MRKSARLTIQRVQIEVLDWISRSLCEGLRLCALHEQGSFRANFRRVVSFDQRQPDQCHTPRTGVAGLRKKRRQSPRSVGPGPPSAASNRAQSINCEMLGLGSLISSGNKWCGSGSSIVRARDENHLTFVVVLRATEQPNLLCLARLCARHGPESDAIFTPAGG